MRATKPILLSVLAITAGASFLAAARSAAELQTPARSWKASLPPARVPDRVSAVAPVILEEELLEEEIIEAQLESAPEAAPGPRKVRKIRPAPAVVPAIAGLEVEPEDAIRMALRSKRASFEHCYEKELKKQASFSGFIVVALSLSASGKVTEARVQEGNRRDAVVGACIVAQLRTMKLPPLTSEADLLIPIRLQAREPT